MSLRDISVRDLAENNLGNFKHTGNLSNRLYRANKSLFSPIHDLFSKVIRYRTCPKLSTSFSGPIILVN